MSSVNRFLVGAIVVSVLLAVLGSEDAIALRFALGFQIAEILVGIVFLLEYTARLWVCVEDPRYHRPVAGRLRYAVTPAALLDLLAISPMFFAAVGSQAYLLRLVRLTRIVRAAKLGRYSRAASEIGDAVHLRRHELLVSLIGGSLLLLISATCLYVAEGSAQPEQFGSIPRAMWWSIATLTTVGYGDVYPVTVEGKILASVTAVIGIGLIALPAGIIASAFSEVLARRREAAAAVAAATAKEPVSFKQAAEDLITRAQRQGRSHVEINAGELHRLAGGYPGQSHHMPMCCEAMYALMRSGDNVVFTPPEGKGASLTIRYLVPRSS